MTADELFRDLGEDLCADAHVTRSTMMGLPCLRWDGRFFASLDKRTGDLIIKLPKARVNELVAAGRAGPFAPAGRRFREWAAINIAQQHLWPGFLDEAQAFARADS